MRQYLLITGNKTVRRFLEFAKNNKQILTDKENKTSKKLSIYILFCISRLMYPEKKLMYAISILKIPTLFYKQKIYKKNRI